MNSLIWMFLVGCTVLLFTAQRAEGIKCYTCVGDGCEDEFDSDATGVMVYENCTASCVKVRLGSIYSRQCDVEKMDDDCTEKDEAAICYCNSDLCNGAINVKTSAFIMVALTSMAFMMRSY